MNSKRLIIDTTYLLPVFGIEIDKSDEEIVQIKNMWIHGLVGFDLYISSISIIEIVYKLNFIFRNQNTNEILDRYPLVLSAILNNPNLHIFYSETDLLASEMAMMIRKMGHTDLLDAWIAGSAYALDGIFLTEERKLIHILKQISEFKSDLIWDWTKLQKELNKNG